MIHRVERHDLTEMAVSKFEPQLGTVHLIRCDRATPSRISRALTALSGRCRAAGDQWDIGFLVMPTGRRYVVVADPAALLAKRPNHWFVQ